MPFTETTRRALCPTLLASACPHSLAPATGQHAHPAPAAPAVAEFGRMGFPTSCDPAIQPRFERAVAMLHSFHPGAGPAFAWVAEADPGCAMAWWGVAISQRPNPLVAPFPPELLGKGWAAVEHARAAGPKTERERDWIEALALFFQDRERVDQRTRTLTYEAAMQRLAAEYPGDDEAQVFYALALNEAVDLSDKTYARQLRAGEILERLDARLPDHPGVPHHLIHSYDYAPLAERGLAAARRYAALAPASGHALHVPSHTFSTLGMWREAIQADRASVAGSAASAGQAEAISWSGRALGAARAGDPTGAGPSLERIRALRERLVRSRETCWAEQTAIMEGAASAWIAFAQGRREEALSLMHAAAELETAARITSPWRTASRRCGSCTPRCRCKPATPRRPCASSR